MTELVAAAMAGRNAELTGWMAAATSRLGNLSTTVTVNESESPTQVLSLEPPPLEVVEG